MPIIFDKPNLNPSHGWYVAEDTKEGFFAEDYLHSDGNVYTSTARTDSDIHSGYFKTELEAYEAIRQYYINKVCS